MAVLCLFLGQAYAQTEGVELLRTALSGMPADTAKADVLNKLAFQYLEVSLDSTQIYVDQAETLSQSLGYRRGLARAINIRAYVLDDRGFSDSALKLQQTALDISSSIGDEEGIARGYGSIAGIAYKKGLYHEALRDYSKALEMNRRRNDLKAITKVYNNMGIINIELGQYDTALEYHFKSLKMSEEAGDEQGIAFAYANIGNIYVEQSKYSEAQENFQKALEISQKIGSKSGVANAFTNIGYVHEQEGRLDKAFLMYQKARLAYQELGNVEGIAATLQSLGDVETKRGAYTEAMQFLQSSLNLCEQSNDRVGIGYARHSMAQTYLRSKRLQDAMREAMTGLAIFTETGSRARIRDIRKTISEIYEAQNQTAQAFHWFKLYNDLKDSLLSVESTRKTVELQLVYDAGKKDQQIEILQKDSTIKALQIGKEANWRFLLFFAIGALGIIVVLSVHRYRLKRRSEDALNVKNVELSKTNAALQETLEKVKTLQGMLPICASCKKVRDDGGYWNQIETYLQEHTDATFTHGLCPDCREKLYPELMRKDEKF